MFSFCLDVWKCGQDCWANDLEMGEPLLLTGGFGSTEGWVK